jgi:hypothetical protein
VIVALREPYCATPSATVRGWGWDIKAGLNYRDQDPLVQLGAPALPGVGQAGVFAEIWRQRLLDCDEVVGIDWA